MRTNRLVLIISALFAVGYVLTSLIIFHNISRSYQKQLREEILPLACKLISTVIKEEAQNLVSVSADISAEISPQDAVLQDATPLQISNHLQEIQRAHPNSDITFVSEKSPRLYFGNGSVRNLAENNPEDTWFFRMRSLPTPYEVRIETAPDAPHRSHISVIRQVFDKDNVFIGALRYTTPASSLQKKLDIHAEYAGFNFYLATPQGLLLLAGGDALQLLSSVKDIKALQELLRRPVNDQTRLTYKHEHTKRHACALFLKDINVFLLIEKPQPQTMFLILPALLQTLFVFLAVGSFAVGICALCLSLYRNKLASMETTDKLTLLTNRHAFEPLFEHALREADRNQSPLTIALFDVDHFKELNDLHGHLAGDAVLISIAESINRAVRRTDCLCRWGGEEFLLLLKDCSLNSGITLAEKIRKDIEETTIFYENDPIHVQVSIGIVEKQEHEDMEWLLQRIEQALLQAKNSGRNRVETI